jgi:hypothetical protein
MTRNFLVIPQEYPAQAVADDGVPLEGDTGCAGFVREETVVDLDSEIPTLWEKSGRRLLRDWKILGHQTNDRRYRHGRQFSLTKVFS